MNHRKFIMDALAHRESGRVPRDLGGMESSGMTVLAYANLCEYLHVNDIPKVFDPHMQLCYIDRSILDRFSIDAANLSPEPRKWISRKHPAGLETLLPEKWNEHTDASGQTVVLDERGVVVARRPAGGLYFDPVNPPLENVTDAGELAKYKKAISGFDWPGFADESLEEFACRAKALHETGRCVVLNLCCHLLAAGQILRGYENFMMDMLADKLLAQSLLQMLVEAYVERFEKLAPSLRQWTDVVLLNDDLGTQSGPMLSPALYREMIKPYQRQLFAAIKKSFDAPLLFHSCGAIREFIPDLIECGVNAINPVQLSAEGMDIAALKKDFGRDVTFWGGGVDTQKVLNRLTPAEVKLAVKRNIDILAPGGGFVFCQVHNIQPDVPPENVVAMFEAVDEYEKR